MLSQTLMVSESCASSAQASQIPGWAAHPRTRESKDTQSMELRFRATLGEQPEVELALV